MDTERLKKYATNMCSKYKGFKHVEVIKSKVELGFDYCLISSFSHKVIFIDVFASYDHVDLNIISVLRKLKVRLRELR